MIEKTDLKEMTYETIDKLAGELGKYRVRLPEYKSCLPAVEISDKEVIGYDPSKNTVYIDITDKEIEDAVAEESMHFLDFAAQNKVGKNTSAIHDYQFIDEFIGSIGRLMIGKNKNVILPETYMKEVKEYSERKRELIDNNSKKGNEAIIKLKKTKAMPQGNKIYKDDINSLKTFFSQMLNLFPYEDNSKKELLKIFPASLIKKYFSSDYEERVKKIIINETIDKAKAEPSLSLHSCHSAEQAHALDGNNVDKEELGEIFGIYEEKSLDFAEHDCEHLDDLQKFNQIDTDSSLFLVDSNQYSLMLHKDGYALAQKVYDSGLKRFLKKNPNFLFESYENKEKAINKFIESPASRIRRFFKRGLKHE